MDALLTEDDRAFRDRITAQLTEVIPSHLRDKIRRDIELDREDFVSSQQALNAIGLAVPHWPEKWGGAGWTAMQRFIYLDQMQRLAIPSPLAFNADMIGPVLAEFGNEEQKARYLPATANLDIWWCQGFSEPNAGSDLASLTCRAEREDDHYVVNGQKTWISYAHHADMMFALLRTDPNAPKKQMGISMILIDMKSPGITVRPIETMDGRAEVNEVFFDNVRVPVENLIGEEGKGWTYAKFLLQSERHNIAGLGWVRMRLERIQELARASGHWVRQDFRSAFARIEIDLASVEMLQLLALRGTSAGSFGHADVAASVLKIRGTQLQQATTRLLLDVLGPDGDAAAGYFTGRKISIYGGSNEIQHEILAKAALRL